MNVRTTLAALILTVFTGPQALANVVVADFSGNINSFWPGPFNGGDLFDIHFEWNAGLSRTSGHSSSSFFQNAMNNVVVDVNGYEIVGTGGLVTQRDDAGVYDLIEFRLGVDYGQVTSAPAINGQQFELLFLRFRTPTDVLFTLPGQHENLIDGSIPLSLDSIDLFFSGTDAINMQSGVTSSSIVGQSVPNPWSLPVALAGLLGVFVARRKRQVG